MEPPPLLLPPPPQPRTSKPATNRAPRGKTEDILRAFPLLRGASSSGIRMRAAAPGNVSVNTAVITNVPFGVDDEVVMLSVPDE